MQTNLIEIFDIIREDLNRAEYVWSGAGFVDDFMAYETEEYDENDDLVSVWCHCESCVAGGFSGGSHCGINKYFGMVSFCIPGDKERALFIVVSLLRFLGSLAEFVENNSEQFDVDVYCPDDALKIINEVISCLERVRGNLKILLDR